MNALSRREEETLMKTTKARALKECDPAVRGTACTIIIIPKWNEQLIHPDSEFAQCACGRTISMAWACKGKLKVVTECMIQL